MDYNNPTTEWVNGKIQTLAKDIVENGGIGTAGKRIIQQISQVVMKDNWLFNQFGKQLQGTGARTNILEYQTRRGWRNTDKNAWRNFGFNQAPSFLTENLQVKERIETSLEWNIKDLQDTEKGTEKLVGLLKSALMEELQVEFEKRVLNKLKDLAKNGKTLVSDDILGNEADYPAAAGYSITVDISSVEATQATIDRMVNLAYKMGKQENPIIYRPNKSKWMWIINTELDAAIQKAGGFREFIGDDAWKRALNNQPTKMLNEIPVLVSNELDATQPFYLVPRQGAFGNIELFYTTLPTGFHTREDFQGESATNKFFKIESDEFAINTSYWATKMGLFAFGTMGTGLTDVNIHFQGSNVATGETTAQYRINGGAAEDYSIYLIDHNYVETPITDTLVVDGTMTLIELGALDTGSYMLQIRDADGFNITTSQTYYVRNRASEIGTNQETTATPTHKEVEKEAPVSKKEIKAAEKEAIKAEVETKVEEAKAEAIKETK